MEGSEAMSGNQSSGFAGILGLVGCIAVFFLVRRFAPGLSAVLLALAGVILLVIVMIVGLVVYFAFHKSKDKQGDGKGTNGLEKDPDRVLASGRAALLEIRKRTIRIRKDEIRGSADVVCKLMEKILQTLKEQPENIPEARQFFDYYLPTLDNILTRYVRVEESGIPAADMEESVRECLENIRLAMEKQYASLFDDDILDLSVEIEVLKTMCKRDGLIEEENFPGQEQKTAK